MLSEQREKRKQIICELVEDKRYVPMRARELAAVLQVSREDRAEFKAALQELLSQGRLTLNERGRYQKGDANPLIGTFVRTGKGFAFVEIAGENTAEADGQGVAGADRQDVYIPEDKTNGAFHKDLVQIAYLPSGHGKRREAQVVRILERGIRQLVGTYEQTKEQYGFVVPDMTRFSKDIFVSADRSMGAVNGHKVVVEITDYGDSRRSPEGKITQIIGHVNDPGVDIMSIVMGYELPVEFPQEVIEQAARAAKEVSEADMAGRKDLRDLTMVTIDGEDAKDLDDAVSVSFDGEYYHLGVHIADVSNYVQEYSALDREALKRGTSVYLVDRVIPMLPHALSNGICSLNEGQNRLALSCLMRVDEKGTIADYEICESVIRVNKRMSYTAVKNLLEDEGLAERDETYRQYADLLPMFVQMRDLAAILREKRKKRGSIDFDFPECKILLDREGRPREIKAYERNVATDIIEDFMLAANETVAQHFYWQELPFVYRVHDVPDADRIRKLTQFIQNYGYYMKSLGRKGSRRGSEEIHPKEIQKLLAKVAGTPEESMISRLALRSMKQAKYSVECTGHFGLACPYYCHFTSPIRRYPDLQIHRIIKEQLRGRMQEERVEHYRSILPEVAQRASRTERVADEAERETDKLKKVEYMEERLGEIYQGVISGVTRWGIYVELPNTVEGMISVTKLSGDYYHFEEKTGELVGKKTGEAFRLGMPVTVRVAACDRAMRTIDFDLLEGEEELTKEGASGRGMSDAGKRLRRKKSKDKRVKRKSLFQSGKGKKGEKAHGKGKGVTETDSQQ